MNNDLLIAAAICSAANKADQSEYEKMTDEQLNSFLTKFQKLKTQTESKEDFIKIDIEIAKIKNALAAHESQCRERRKNENAMCVLTIVFGIICPITLFVTLPIIYFYERKQHDAA